MLNKHVFVISSVTSFIVSKLIIESYKLEPDQIIILYHNHISQLGDLSQLLTYPHHCLAIDEYDAKYNGYNQEAIITSFLNFYQEFKLARQTNDNSKLQALFDHSFSMNVKTCYENVNKFLVSFLPLLANKETRSDSSEHSNGQFSSPAPADYCPYVLYLPHLDNFFYSFLARCKFCSYINFIESDLSSFSSDPKTGTNLYAKSHKITSNSINEAYFEVFKHSHVHLDENLALINQINLEAIFPQTYGLNNLTSDLLPYASVKTILERQTSFNCFRLTDFSFNDQIMYQPTFTYTSEQPQTYLLNQLKVLQEENSMSFNLITFIQDVIVTSLNHSFNLEPQLKAYLVQAYLDFTNKSVLAPEFNGFGKFNLPVLLAEDFKTPTIKQQELIKYYYRQILSSITKNYTNLKEFPYLIISLPANCSNTNHQTISRTNCNDISNSNLNLTSSHKEQLQLTTILTDLCQEFGFKPYFLQDLVSLELLLSSLPPKTFTVYGGNRIELTHAQTYNQIVIPTHYLLVNLNQTLNYDFKLHHLNLSNFFGQHVNYKLNSRYNSNFNSRFERIEEILTATVNEWFGAELSQQLQELQKLQVTAPVHQQAISSSQAQQPKMAEMNTQPALFVNSSALASQHNSVTDLTLDTPNTTTTENLPEHQDRTSEQEQSSQASTLEQDQASLTISPEQIHACKTYLLTCTNPRPSNIKRIFYVCDENSVKLCARYCHNFKFDPNDILILCPHAEFRDAFPQIQAYKFIYFTELDLEFKANNLAFNLDRYLTISYKLQQQVLSLVEGEGYDLFIGNINQYLAMSIMLTPQCYSVYLLDIADKRFAYADLGQTAATNFYLQFREIHPYYNFKTCIGSHRFNFNDAISTTEVSDFGMVRIEGRHIRFSF